MSLTFFIHSIHLAYYLHSPGTTATAATGDDVVYEEPLLSAKDVKPDDKGQLLEYASVDPNPYSEFAP